MGLTSPLLRRSENLARALEGAEAPSDENRALVALAAALAQMPDPVIDRRFARSLERTLAGVAPLRIVAEPTAAPARRLDLRRAIVGFGLAASIVAIAAIVVGDGGRPADQALPAPSRPAPEIERPAVSPARPDPAARVLPARERPADRPAPGPVARPNPDRDPPVDNQGPPPPPEEPPLFQTTHHAFVNPVQIASP